MEQLLPGFRSTCLCYIQENTFNIFVCSDPTYISDMVPDTDHFDRHISASYWSLVYRPCLKWRRTFYQRHFNVGNEMIFKLHACFLQENSSFKFNLLFFIISLLFCCCCCLMCVCVVCMCEGGSGVVVLVGSMSWWYQQHVLPSNYLCGTRDIHHQAKPIQHVQ